MENKPKAEREPSLLATPGIDDLWNTLIQDATADFRHKHLDRPPWMRDLSQEQIRILCERFQCLLGRRQLRVHRDYVNCSHCCCVVEDLAIESKRILETEGREIAERIKAKAIRDRGADR